MFVAKLLRGRSFGCAPLSSSSTGREQILKVGDVLRLSRRFTEADVLAYSKVSGDANPVHFDADLARTAAGFSGPVVHGMLVASLFPTVIASSFWIYYVCESLGHLIFGGAIYISQTLQFKLPVYVDDDILAEVQPTHLRENKKRYIAKFYTKCFRDGGKTLVLDGEATAILPTLKLIF